MPFDETAATEFGIVKTHLEKKDAPIGEYDIMIAAHAMALDTILVTNNSREFKRVPELKIENWA